MGLWHLTTTKADTHQLRTAPPRTPPSPSPRLTHQTPIPEPSPAGRWRAALPFPAPRQRARPWERQAGRAKSDLTCSSPPACQERRMSALRGTRRPSAAPLADSPFPLAASSPLSCLFPLLLGKKEVLHPASLRDRKVPSLPKKGRLSTPAPHHGHRRQALRAPSEHPQLCPLCCPALRRPHASGTRRLEGKSRISSQVNFSRLPEP